VSGAIIEHVQIHVEDAMQKLTVLYDGSCRFCASSRHWLEAHPAYIPLEFIPATRVAETASRFPGLDGPGAGEEPVVVDDEGGVYRGVAAWVMCLWALEDYRPFAAKLSSQALLPYARQAFELVTRNRKKLAQTLTLRSEGDLAGMLRHIPPTVCGPRSQALALPVPEDRRGRLILRVILLTILSWWALGLLAANRKPILLWCLSRGVISSGSVLRGAGLDLESVLREAAGQGRIDRVQDLLAAGVDATAAGADGRNALVLAAVANRRDVVALLRKAGANPDARNHAGETALMREAASWNVVTVQGLLFAGADPNARDIQGRTALMIAIESGRNLDVVRALLAAGADANTRGPAGRTALMAAADYGLTQIVRALLAAGANPDAQDDDGRTALIWTEAGPGRVPAKPDTVKALLEGGANPNIRNHNAHSVLQLAVAHRHTEIVTLLLSAGAEAEAGIPEPSRR
jgi:ankyrin repeat protein/predicted DCC family thiol-disulfide oxidoreductase YuxK